jgi:hypothetical protein
LPIGHCPKKMWTICCTVATHPRISARFVNV